MTNINLGIYRKLEGLTEEELDHFRKGDVERILEADAPDTLFVDGDQARDYEYTQVLMEKTVGYALVDPDGVILALVDSLQKAEEMRAGAKITFNVSLPDEEPAFSF